MDHSWMADAACVDLGADLFHPDRWDFVALTAAKAVCAACPVKAACLAYALGAKGWTPEGVWAGTTARERQRLRARRGTAA